MLAGRLRFGDAALSARFWDKVTPEPNSGCWLWTSSGTTQGYGKFSVAGARVVAHRVTFLAAHGEVPAGMELDHLCKTRCCVNPEHLEAVTHAVNCRRGSGITSHLASRTTCLYGHAFDQSNTRHRVIRGVPVRVCVACLRYAHKKTIRLASKAGR